MCGVVGIVAAHPVNQSLYDALLLMQHRGQDAAGIATAQGKRIHLSRGTGLVRDVFRTRDMRNLFGNMGIGHVRYPTAGSAMSAEEAQPFYVNAPFGIVLGHNGNLTNAGELQDDMYRRDRRHINTESDSEVLLNVFAHELQQAVSGLTLDPDAVFAAVSILQRRAKGAYACVTMIPGFGVIGFRDPYGIRPLVLGERE
ncbi:MAG: amidophosphoribosyltransferase, partial [Burkholderiaceae bacterium]